MFFTRPASRKSSARVSKAAESTRRRKLFFESLEDRRMLALTLGAWSAVASMPTPRSQTAAAVDSNSHLIYLAGGFNSSGASLSSFEIYNPVANSWSTGPSLPIPTRGAAAAYASGNIYVFGGFNGGNIGAVQRFNIGSNSWNTFSFPAGSWESASVAANGKIYVFGGEGTDGVTSEFDPATNSTVTKAAMPHSMKQHNAGAIGGFIYVAGGASPGGAQAFVNRYDPVNNSWSTAPADMPSARLQYAGGVLQGNFLAAGGSTSGSNYSSPYFNTFVSYDPVADAWTNQPTLPVALRESSGAVDGNSFYVFGGNNGGSESGAVYKISAAVSATGSVGVAIDDSGERLLIFDPATGTQTGLVTIPNSDFHLDTVISPDGKFAYVSSYNSNRIYIVDLTTKALASGTNPLNLPGNIEDLTITPDGKFLLAVDGGGINPIIVVDTATRATVFALNEGISHSGVDVTASGDVLVGSLSLGTTRRYTINGAGALTFTGQQIGGGGQNVIAAPNGVTAVQTNSSVVMSFFISGMSGAASVTPGGIVQNMVFSPDGSKLYVVHANSVAAYNYNQTTGAIGALLFDVGGYSPPVGWYGVDVFDVTPDGSRLYVSTGNQIVALNALTGANLGNITLGGAQFYGVDIAGTASNNVTADANGPYTINEGQPLNLDATGSTASASATYEWDVDGDGDFDENITGKTVTVTWAQLQALGIADGPSSGNITVRVTEPGGGATTSELIVNGTFETGNLGGWTVGGSGGWTINNGSFVPPGSGGPIAPISGIYDAQSFQSNPSLNILSEPIIVPSGISAATLSWSDRIRNFGGAFSDPDQEFRVNILTSGGSLIQQVYSTNPGDPLTQIGPNSRSFNLTSLLQSLSGQTIRVSFEQEDNLGYFNVNVDNVSLQVTTGGGGGLVEYVTNGTFESGNTSGWTINTSGSGQWIVNNGGFDPDGPGGPTPPLAGSFDVVSNQTSSSTQFLSQPIVVPAGVTSATLSWLDRIQSYTTFSDPAQEFRVLVLNSSGGLIQQIYSTNPGDPTTQFGPNSRTFNITALMQSLAGQSIRLSFQVEDQNFFFNVNLDNISLQMATGGGGGGGGVDTDTTTLTINNVSPTITSFVIPSLVLVGTPINLSTAATDPAGPADPLTFTWTITRPDLSTLTLGGTSPSFIPAQQGSYGVSLVVDDGDLGTATATASINVAGTFVTLSGNDLVIQDNLAGGKNDDLRVSYDPANDWFDIVDPVNLLFVDPLAGTQVDPHHIRVLRSSFSGNILVNTLDGNDSLTVDASLKTTGRPIFYDGGNPTTGPGDQLKLASAATPVTTTTYNYTNANSGNVSIDGYVVTYTGLEPITSTINAVNVILNYSTTVEILTVISAGAGSTNVSSNVAAETTTFANPTGTLTINAGNTGGDTINVNGLGSGFNANLTIDGQTGTDIVNFAGAVNLGAGNLNVTAETINSNATVTTTGAAVLNANSGAITDGNGSSVNIVAASLVATATTGISLDTTVANLEASGGSGGVDIEDTDGLIVGNISGVIGISATGGDITVTANGPLVVNEAVSNTGPGNVTLSANSSGGAGIAGGGSTAGLDTLAVGSSSGNQALNQAYAQGDLVGTITRLNNTATFNGMSVAALRAQYDLIFATWNSDAGLNYDWATRLQPFIALGGSVIFEDPNNVDDLAAVINASSSGGGGPYSLITVDPILTANLVNPFQLANHHIVVNSFNGGLFSPYVQQDSTLQLLGVIGDFGTGRFVLVGPDGDFHADKFGGTTPLNNYNMLINQANWASIGGGANPTDDLTLNANVSALGGNVTLNAASDILQNTGSVSTTGSGFVDYNAGTGTSSGAITMADGTSATSGTGLMTLDADGNIQLSLVQTGNATGNAVLVTSTSGAITDADNNSGLDISAVNGGAILSAATGVGAAGSNATIEINVINLDVHNNTSGGIFVTDTAGGLTLSALSGPTSVSGVGGNGLITANSPLTIAASATTSGGMTYTATDSAGAGDNLTINAGVAVTDTTASLTFNAGDDFLLTNTASISAATTVTINIDAGNADSGVGATANIFGALAASGGAGINGNADSDTFNITGPTVGALDSITAAVTVNGGAGVNTLNLSDANDATGDIATITQSTVEGLGGSPGTDYTFSNIANLDVTGTGAGDSITTTLGGAPSFNGLVNVDVRGNGGNDDLFLHVADSASNATLDFVRLFGDAGGDNFGGSAAVDRIRPVLATGQTQIIINGDANAKTTGPVNPGTDPTLTSPDRLFLDLTTTDSGATVNPIVIVDTNGGYADAANTQSFRYNGIEDIDLYDNNVLTNTAIGDFFLRATNNPDYILFMSAAQVNPTFRIRIGNQYYPTNGGQYGPYTTGSSNVFVYGQGGNDTISMYNTRLNAAFFGEEGHDILTGGYGNDLLVGGAGNDRINGGTVGGNDTIWGDDFNPATDDPAVASQTSSGGNDQINTFGGSDTIYGQGGNDIINSGAGDDYINGGAGDDLIDGQAGNDRIYGGAGNDVMSGSDGNDLIAGNDGNDTLNGRTGNDILIGGLGQDILNGHEGGDALVGDESNGSGSKSLAKDDAVDVALTALLLAWGSSPTLGNLSGLDSAGADGSEDTLYGGAAADAFFGLGALLDKAPDRNAPGYGPDLN